MSMTAAHHYFRDKHCDYQAEQASMEALLNCYCRDIAQPAAELSIQTGPGSQPWPQALRTRLTLEAANVLEIALPGSEDILLVLVAGDSPTCNYRYLSAPFYKSALRGWQILGLEQLARLLLNSMAERFHQPINSELYRQILLSREVMGTVLAYSQVPNDWGQGTEAFRWSEQSLSFGHRYHPAPKSREGFDTEDILQYSPEMGSGFALYYFAVNPDDLRTRGKVTDAFDADGPNSDLDVPNGLIPLAVHPWQARYLMRQPPVQRAIRSGRIVPLGQTGPRYYPTASVRTLYKPGAPYFLKFSTHVRLTNCIRKNAIYELESAVALSEALKNHLAPALNRWPGFRLLYEPAYQTLDFPELAAPERKTIAEGFGVILRDNLEQQLEPGVTPMLAAALFSEDRYGRCRATEASALWAQQAGLSERQARVQWLGQYLALLLPPLFESLFHCGVVFEPHLQNVVVGLRDGCPVQVFVRDLEGTKLVPERWSGSLPATIDKRTLASIHYPQDKAWKRIAYCLLVNHLFQVVACLSRGEQQTEIQLWAALAEAVRSWLDSTDDPWAQEALGNLLAGEPIPNKSNLMTRLFKRPDRESQYTLVPNPLAGLPTRPNANPIKEDQPDA
ncbi:IucA/IucC family protein [Marinobacter apostichopi]|uniref:IucA/IucC family protein n=1 Tax=Marinobacter apostichopi TaxID=3035454 RepID=UPI002572E068|nr:IucA/IucC family protein [Marinobacter sp. LA51]